MGIACVGSVDVNLGSQVHRVKNLYVKESATKTLVGAFVTPASASAMRAGPVLGATRSFAHAIARHLWLTQVLEEFACRHSGASATLGTWGRTAVSAFSVRTIARVTAAVTPGSVDASRVGLGTRVR